MQSGSQFVQKNLPNVQNKGVGGWGVKGVLNNVEKIAQSVERDIPNIVRGFVTSGILFVDVFIVFQFSIE